MQNCFALGGLDRVAGIGPALKADNHLALRAQQVNNFSLAFVAPLRANNHSI